MGTIILLLVNIGSLKRVITKNICDAFQCANSTNYKQTYFKHHVQQFAGRVSSNPTQGINTNGVCYTAFTRL